MLALWERMGPLPANLRLYGGTALALYLNHRLSVDFDFATPEPVVDIDLARSLSWAAGAKLNGGVGMVDGIIEENARRPIRFTLMECGPMIPLPEHSPIRASNGVRVAHPIDILRSKLVACLSRGAERDYQDIAAAAQSMPEYVAQAAKAVPGRSPLDVARALSNFGELPPEVSETIRKVALSIGGRIKR